jgi:uncharacterized protein YcaQ
MSPELTLSHVRRFAVARTLFRPTTLAAAIERLGFVQADPIRSPARAQDLILRHRVRGYRAGDLERAYPQLPVDEDTFINYGFLPVATPALWHPRQRRQPWTPERAAQAREVLEFVRERGVVHPREVDEHFQHGRVTNWFGGTSNASTHLLDSMHDRGLLRVAGRVSGTRTYQAVSRPPSGVDPDQALDRMLDVAVGLYAPLPLSGLRTLTSMLGAAAPQWRDRRRATLARARDRLAGASVAGTEWFWPADEDPSGHSAANTVRLLAPFDPIVWDRTRFEMLWGWAYRFEAYTPAAKRIRGYYALPLLWRDQVVGWANVSARTSTLAVDVGYVAGRPPDHRGYPDALQAELDRMAAFLGVASPGSGG